MTVRQLRPCPLCGGLAFYWQLAGAEGYKKIMCHRCGTFVLEPTLPLGAELTADYRVTEWWRLRGGYSELRVHIRSKPGSTDTTAGAAEAADSDHHFSLRSAVITDLGMLYVDGHQVAAPIKAVAPMPPIILLTGWGQRLEAEGDVPPHIDRILSKPPKLREIRATLAELTASAAQTRLS